MSLFNRHQNNSSDTKDTFDDKEEYYVYPVDSSMGLHNPDHLFCDDPSCPCHEDQENMETLLEWYEEGVVGPADGDHIYRGRTI